MKIEKHKKIALSVIFKMMFVYVIYGMLMNEFLLNRQDGMWNGTYFFAGNWELSLGRWAIRYLDKLHFGISVHPLSTLITLFLFVMGTYLMVDLFNIEVNTIWDYLISCLFLSNMVVCISLSYLYTSNIYGLSFFLSMLCIWLIRKNAENIENNIKGVNRKWNIVLYLGSALCLTMVLGLYQAYLGCIVLTALLYLIYIVSNHYSVKYIRNYLKGGLLSSIVGFGLYEVILHEELARYEVKMSSYNGADSLSVKNIFTNLIPSIKRTYTIITEYLIGEGAYWNLLSGKYMIVLYIALLVVMVIFTYFYCKKNIVTTLVVLMFIMIIPIAANIVAILIPSSGYLEQQTAPCALLFPLALCVISRQLQEIITIKIKKVFEVLICIMTIIIMWGSIYQVQIDQEAIRQGTNAAKTISQEILGELCDKNLYSIDKQYAIIGAPYNNPMIYTNALYAQSNGYARVAGDYWGNDLDCFLWRQLFANLLGINLPGCDGTVYEQLLKEQRVQDMPLFPSEGSIQEINGVIVIHVS